MKELSFFLLINLFLYYRKNTPMNNYCSRHLLVQGQKWKHQNNVQNLFKVNNKNTQRHQRHRSGVFIINFE